MKIEFHGTRGSIPTPSRRTQKFGGNTACIEVRTRSNDLIVLDAGTGIRRLGVNILQGDQAAIELMQAVEFTLESLAMDEHLERSEGLRALEGSKPYKKEIHLFLSHFHWDHIQGWPFFVPAYVPLFNISIYGHLKADHRLFDVINGQQNLTYFPVYLDIMQSKKNFIELAEDTVCVGDTTVTSRFLNHPQGCLGYRITSGEMTVAYCTDNEHPADGSINPNVLELADGADIFIYDTQYTPEEYKTKPGWGHSTYEEGVRIAREAGAGKLVLWHHDPEHDDKFMEDLERKARDLFPNTMAAYEGLVITDFPCEPTESPAGDEAEATAAAQAPDMHITPAAAVINPGATFLSLADPGFLARFGKALDQGLPPVDFDCAAVDFTSRHGLSALADLTGALQRRGVPISFSSMPDPVARMLHHTRFNLIASMQYTPPKY